jgi:tripartite-type tricarboxylate transporter receptor subunit TctC
MQNLAPRINKTHTAIGPRPQHSVARAIAGSMLLSATLIVAATAEEYPNRPVRFVVAFAPGGITDIIARLVGERLSERLGQTIVIDNKGGAAGALGAKLVSTSEPDGYTFLVTTTAIAVNAAASPISIDPRTQLVPVAMAASSPTIIAARTPATSKSLPEFVRNLKQDVLTYASSGAGTVEHLTAAYLLQGISGIAATHVPYRGGAEAINAVIGNHVNLSSTPVGSAISVVQNHQLQILGVASHKRVAMLPDVPTFGESGLADMDSASWVAIFGPPRLPSAVTERINAGVNDAMRRPEVRERLLKIGFDLRGSSQQEFSAQIQAEVIKWTRILNETGITLN